MASTLFNTNDPLAVKVWARKLDVQALSETTLWKFMSKGTDNIIQIRDELSKGPGDQITYGLRMQLQGGGVQGDSTLEGDEEGLQTYSDALLINQLRHAVRASGRMSQQRVSFDLRDESLSGLKDWWSSRLDRCGFMQLCGNPVGTDDDVSATGVILGSDTRYTGNNAILAPDASHYANAASSPIYGLASPTYTDADVASPTFTGLQASGVSAAFTLQHIDRMKERAKTAKPLMRPVKIKGKDYFVLFLHPYQVTSLRTNTQNGQWLDIQKAAMTGGEITSNPIFDGSLGVYNGVILHEDLRVSQGYASGVIIPTVRRAVLCGAQAMTIAFGRNNGPTKYTWDEELFDYGNQFGVAAGMIFGLKKTRFNGMDFGSITFSTYAAPS